MYVDREWDIFRSGLFELFENLGKVGWAVYVGVATHDYGLLRACKRGCLWD
jgi:hypothetical protein